MAAELHMADLRNLSDTFRRAHEAEALTADDGARLQHAGRTELRSGHEHDAGIKDAVFPELTILSDVAAGKNNAALAYSGARTDVAERIDGAILAKLRFGVNAGHVAYARKAALRLDKQRQCLREHGIGIVRHEGTNNVILMFRPHDDGPRPGGGQL